MAKMNGTIWKILGFAVTVVVLAGGLIYQYATMGHTVEDNCEDITAVERVNEAQSAEISENSTHRVIDELNTKYMEKRFDRIEGSMDDFATEQRAVNKEILDKLDEK